MLRRELHAHPELSGCEKETASRILRRFEALRPDETIVGLGGSGIAFVFSGVEPGPTVMLRCELDALPIPESLEIEHRSQFDGVSHKCGHDGHMAILWAVGARLSQSRPSRGRVALVFQPAEETGTGAAAVIADPRFEAVRPDYVFALHNLPRYDLGTVVVREGIFTSASRGAVIRLSGRTAHAAQPETGISPALAMCRVIEKLQSIASILEIGEEVAFATVVGARLGERAFGTAPGEAEVYATLRAETDGTMERMVARLSAIVEAQSVSENLRAKITYEDVFETTINAPRAVEAIKLAASRCGLSVEFPPRAFRWSEDFGRFTAIAEGAMFGLGAGVRQADLHDPDYDFPDELISIGTELLSEIVMDALKR